MGMRLILTSVVTTFLLVASSCSALGKALIDDNANPPTPFATMLNCDKNSQSYVLWTLQSSTSSKDKLKQRYETQVLSSGAWSTIDKTAWRSIPRQSRAVSSKTKVSVANAEGKEVRELAYFRWIYQSKDKHGKTEELTRVTRDLQKPVSGSATCKF